MEGYWLFCHQLCVRCLFFVLNNNFPWTYVKTELFATYGLVAWNRKSHSLPKSHETAPRSLLSSCMVWCHRWKFFHHSIECIYVLYFLNAAFLWISLQLKGSCWNMFGKEISITVKDEIFPTTAVWAWCNKSMQSKWHWHRLSFVYAAGYQGHIV